MDFLSDRDRLEQGEFREEIAWQRGMDFAVAVYRLTDGWPRVDPLDLTADIRRNAVDLPGTIARGMGSGDREMLLECLGIVLDTARELTAQFGLAARVGYCSHEVASDCTERIAQISHHVENMRLRYLAP